MTKTEEKRRIAKEYEDKIVRLREEKNRKLARIDEEIKAEGGGSQVQIKGRICRYLIWEMHKKGLKPEDISDILGRSVNGVREHIRWMRYTEKPDPKYPKLGEIMQHHHNKYRKLWLDFMGFKDKRKEA